jgi:hypothetical protein
MFFAIYTIGVCKNTQYHKREILADYLVIKKKYYLCKKFNYQALNVLEKDNH